MVVSTLTLMAAVLCPWRDYAEKQNRMENVMTSLWKAGQDLSHIMPPIPYKGLSPVIWGDLKKWKHKNIQEIFPSFSQLWRMPWQWWLMPTGSNEVAFTWIESVLETWLGPWYRYSAFHTLRAAKEGQSLRWQPPQRGFQDLGDNPTPSETRETVDHSGSKIRTLKKESPFSCWNLTGYLGRGLGEGFAMAGFVSVWLIWCLPI